MGSLVTAINPKTFGFMLTFNILIIVVAGGPGSITGSVITSVIYTVLLEALRPIESGWSIGPLHVLDPRPAHGGVRPGAAGDHPVLPEVCSEGASSRGTACSTGSTASGIGSRRWQDERA